METSVYEVRVIEDGSEDLVRFYTDKREAEREYRRLARAKVHVTLACRLPDSKVRAA